MRPAAHGTLPRTRSRIRLAPAKPGLTFHGTRHGHKTWMIADGIPEAAQDLRLGHLMPDKVRKTYSHVATSIEQRLLQCLQERWVVTAADDQLNPHTGSSVDAVWLPLDPGGDWRDIRPGRQDLYKRLDWVSHTTVRLLRTRLSCDAYHPRLHRQLRSPFRFRVVGGSVAWEQIGSPGMH